MHSVEGDANLSVQIDELREVAELRWDSAIEIIRVEVPEKAPLSHMRFTNVNFKLQCQITEF